MAGFHLQNPAVLAALLALPVLGRLWLAAARSAALAEEALTGSARSSGPNARRGVLRLAALGLVIVGLSGPTLLTHAGAAAAKPPVVFVLDVSASMMAGDVPPTRLAAAREAVGQTAGLLAGSPVGLVLAATDAVPACPLTKDQDALRLLLAAADETRLQQGTQLRPALETAAKVLGDRGGVGAIIIVSDGEDFGPPLREAIRAACDEGAIVHTITVGSQGGAPVSRLPVAGDPPAGAHTRARPDDMAAWAAAGGGCAWTIAPGERDLPEGAGEVLPPRLQLRSADRQGTSTGLGWLCYAAAAVLVAVDLLLRG
jgi:Ca-activated chloride channel family protein